MRQIKNNILGDEPCPQCRSMGRDKTGNHLMRFADGGAYCNRCGYHEPKPREELKQLLNTPTPWEGKSSAMTALHFDNIPLLPLKASPIRGWSLEAATHYGVVSSCDESTGVINKHYYPITVNGEVVSYRVRELPKTFHNISKYSLKGVKVDLFGQSVTPRGGKRLLITGGQDDMLAAFDLLKKYNIKVVSVTNGENISSIADNLDYVLSFNEVILCFDNDVAGEKLTEKAVKLIGMEKARVMVYSEKDPNDMLLKGKQAEFVNAFFSAKQYVPVDIVIGGVGKETLLEPIKQGIRVPTLPGTMEKMKGLRQGELTLILAPAGVGKTTIMKEIGYSLVKQGVNMLHVFLEEDLKKTQQSYICLDNNIPLPKFRENPELLSKELFDKSYNELIDNGKTVWVNHWGSMSPDKVMETFRYADSIGCEMGLLDHVSMVFSGSETVNERKEIDILLTNMAAFTKESDMHIIIVSHIKRQDKRWKPKEYPYWETVASDAGRGSGAFEQLAHNIITLEVEFIDEDMNKGRIRTRVAKNREWGLLGVGDVLKYDYGTGRIVPQIRDDF